MRDKLNWKHQRAVLGSILIILRQFALSKLKTQIIKLQEENSSFRDNTNLCFIPSYTRTTYRDSTQKRVKIERDVDLSIDGI